MRGTGLFLIAVVSVWPSSGRLNAHPHIFVNSEVTLIFGKDGKLSALRILWSYDELYSLLLLEERGMDGDGDGKLTAQESADLRGFDMNWQPGFAGDSYLLQGAEPLVLSPPQDFTSDYKDGRLISTHVRRVLPEADPAQGPLVVQLYDPTYYTAYSIDLSPGIEGRTDCSVTVYEPDSSAVPEQLLASLEEQLGEAVPVADFPSVGAALAEEIHLSCGD